MSNNAQLSWMERTGATPGKLVLVAVLGIVLVSVYVYQFGGSGEPTVELVVPKELQSEAPTLRIQTNLDEDALASRAWPPAELDTVVAYDPFALPFWAKTTLSASRANGDAEENKLAEEQKKKVLDSLRQQGATVIVVVDGEPLALIGDKTIRVGDRLEGFQVKQISQSGITLTGEGQTE